MGALKNYSLVTPISIFSFLIVFLILTPSDTPARDSSSVSTTISDRALKNPEDGQSDKAITPSTSFTESSTASAITEQCPVSMVFEGDQHQQALLRDFRDEVLAQHANGIAYTKRYYLHSPEITLIILTNNYIREHAQKIFSEIIPIVSDLLKTGEAKLSEHFLEDADKLLNEIAHRASPSLRETIKRAKSDIIKKEIFEELNITITK